MATTKSDILKKKLVQALEKSLGVITTACKQTGVNRSTFYEWYNKDEVFKKSVDSIGDIALDFAESQLHKQIQDGNTTATIFFLKTKGKKRGYVERLDVQQHNYNLDLTEKEAKLINKAVEEKY